MIELSKITDKKDETLWVEASVLYQYLLGKELSRDSLFFVLYSDVHEKCSSKILASNLGAFSTFLSTTALSNRSLMAYVDIWTSFFDKSSIFRHKLLLAVALLECIPSNAHFHNCAIKEESVWANVSLFIQRLFGYVFNMVIANIVILFVFLKFILSRFMQLNCGKKTNLLYSDANFIISHHNVSHAAVEAELLVEMAKQQSGNKILDIGTGSGFIAIQLAKNNNYDVVASDLSEDAIKVASSNAEGTGVNIKFIHSDLFSKIDERFDTIIFNPPIIPSASSETTVISQWIRKYTILTAIAVRIGILFYGNKRLELIMRCVESALPHLTQKGHLILYITPYELSRILKDFGSIRPVDLIKGSFNFYVVCFQKV